MPRPHGFRYTHCQRRGHPLTPDNVYIRPDNGGRECRECRRIAQRAYYRREKLADRRGAPRE